MRLLDKHYIQVMKKTLLALLLGSTLAGCESLGLKDQQWDLEVKDYSKKEVFIVENKSIASSVSLQIEGQLSHDATLTWSEKAPEADTTAYSHRELVLAKGKVNAQKSSDYYSKKLYVTYIPSSDSTSGNLAIKVKI